MWVSVCKGVWCVCVYVCMRVCLFMCACLCMCMCACACLHACAPLCARKHKCTCACMCVCIFMCTYISTSVISVCSLMCACVYARDRKLHTTFDGVSNRNLFFNPPALFLIPQAHFQPQGLSWPIFNLRGRFLTLPVHATYL